MSEENLLGGVLQAQVRVEGLPAIRRVIALEHQLDGVWRVCGYGESGADGQAEVAVSGHQESTIYALALDSWGKPWVPSMVLNVGDVVRPTEFTGWHYRATQAGTLTAAEPAWWIGTDQGPRPVGTAMLEAERYYQPIAHGPVLVEWNEIESDPYWEYVVCLMHFEGTSGSDVFDDEAGNSWTPVRGIPSISTQHRLFGVSSGLFRGAVLASAPSSRWAFGLEDFTVEAAIRADNLGTGALFDSPLGNWSAGSGWCFFITPQGALNFNANNMSVGSSAGVIAPNTWLRVAVSRISGIAYLFCEGQLVASGGLNTNLTRQDSMRLGSNLVGSGDDYEGFLDEIRVTKGVGRYSESYSLPVVAFPNS